MKYKTKTCKVCSILLISGILTSVPNVRSEAAVITSNATDKIAVVFHENTAYSAGDYVIYDGEMYICTEDVQGAWSTAEPNFMQITKNHALGSAEDLSASYDASKDPSNETSLMAFAANVWQKLKGFLGMDSKEAGTDAAHYKDASVSAKLNYLEEQNQTLHQNIATLQDGVSQTFTSVSNGKSLIAGAITDKQGTADAGYSFEQFGQAIRDLAQLQYQAGDSAGYNRGKEEGYQEGVGFADGRVNENSQSYQAGIAFADGRVNENSQSYQAGIAFADGRVNEDSESYKKGQESSNSKTWSIRIRVDANGPDKESECFTKTAGATSNHVNWLYKKSFPGQKILAIRVKEHYFSPFGSSNMKTLAIYMDHHYESISEGGTRLTLSEDSFQWGNIAFNLSDTGIYSDLEITVLYS